MSINWGSLQQGGGFQNALAMGMQMGQFARQRQDEKEYKNALATVLMPQGGTSGGQAPGMGGMGGGIVATPEQKAQSEAMRAQFPNAPEYAPDNERAEAMRVIAQRNPQLFTQMQGQAAASQQAAAEQRRADLPMTVRLLESATNEQTYQRSLQVARQYGIDTSTLPPNFDPEWRDTNLKLLKGISTPEGQEVMSAAGKQAFDENFKPGTPEFAARAKEIWQQSGAIPYTGENGETRLYVPGRGIPTQQPIAEGTVIANDAGEQMILRNGRWESMPKGGAGAPASGSF